MSTRESVAGELEAMEEARREMGPVRAMEEMRWVARWGGVAGPRKNGKRAFQVAVSLKLIERQAGRWYVSAAGARALHAWDSFITLSRYVSEVLR